MKDNDTNKGKENILTLLNEDFIGGLGLREHISLARNTFYCRFRVAKVNKTLAKTKTGKAMGKVAFKKRLRNV